MGRWLVSLLFPVLISTTSLLHRTPINPDPSSKALCNDHTPAKYYLSQSPGSTKWVVYFESGGGCTTQEGCEARYASSQILMSSSWLEGEVEGMDVLSEDADNPFSGYNKVYLPYCSSDMYVGMGEATEGFTGTNFVFAGYHIVKELFEALMSLDSGALVDDADTLVVLAGSSAGGIGVINHLKTLADPTYGAGLTQSTLRGLVDSAWFINFEDNFQQLWNTEAAQTLTNYQEFPSGKCEPGLDYAGMPCCFQPDCMQHHGAFTDLEILFIVSKNDIYLLQSSIVRSLSSSTMNAITLSYVADVAASYGGAMMLSVNSTKNHKLSYYITSCLQHVYLAPSSLWSDGEPLNALDKKGYDNLLKQSGAQSFPVSFTQSITPGTMYKVKVGPPQYEEKYLSEVLKTWSVPGSDPLYVHDGCVGIDCNPSCPEQLEFVYTTNSWSESAVITVVCMLATITICCLIWKLTIMFMFHWLLIKQQNNLKGLQQTETFIPALGPSDMMSVSCVDLCHTVNYANESEEPDSGMSYKRLESDIEATANGRENGKPPNLVKQKSSKLSSISLHLTKRAREKKILDKVSVYFNPCSFVGIMGPSGCGKTTFLDIMTGRRELSISQRSNILIDGQDFSSMKEEFTKMLAYVLQLERPYHDALTVRENLTFEALMRLPKDCDLSTVFNRVETVLKECALDKIAEAKVGGDAGGGISGGQKRKLCVALQLIDYPSILFLDEPTSGLDSTSSYELISMLSKLQVSKRCIVLTIHQPRQEIFHLFTHILLLVGGQVAYYGSPMKAYSVLEAGMHAHHRKIEDFVGDADIKNEADLLMDMLNHKEAQKIMIDYYKTTELDNVKKIIEKTRDLKPVNKRTVTSHKKIQEAGGFIRTILALESRIMLQRTIFQTLYLPLIFLFVPLVLGYVYWNASNSVLIISVYCVVTCMGPLFMTSIIMNLINDTLRVFLMQYKDGIGCLYHVVFMVFYRLVGITTGPMLLCSITIYFMVNFEIDLWTFVQVSVILIALCQAWIGVFSSVVYAGPTVALKICPMVSALSAFTSGFLVPEPNMPVPFYALFFFNPTFWAIKAITKLLLQDKLFGCDPYTSKLSCQISSGNFNLGSFGFLDGSPVTTGLVLLSFIVLTQMFSVWVLLYKHSPEPIHKVFKKWLSNFRCSFSLPTILCQGKVSPGELIIVRHKQIQPKKEWARVIEKVITQRKETYSNQIAEGRIIHSDFLEGFGHFLYRRGTNSETILDSHYRKVRFENGVTEDMVANIFLMMSKKAQDKSKNRLPSDSQTTGNFKMQHQVEIKSHRMVEENRKKILIANRYYNKKFIEAANAARAFRPPQKLHSNPEESEPSTSEIGGKQTVNFAMSLPSHMDHIDDLDSLDNGINRGGLQAEDSDDVFYNTSRRASDLAPTTSSSSTQLHKRHSIPGNEDGVRVTRPGNEEGVTLPAQTIQGSKHVGFRLGEGSPENVGFRLGEGSERVEDVEEQHDNLAYSSDVIEVSDRAESDRLDRSTRV